MQYEFDKVQEVNTESTTGKCTFSESEFDFETPNEDVITNTKFQNHSWTSKTAQTSHYAPVNQTSIDNPTTRV